MKFLELKRRRVYFPKKIKLYSLLKKKEENGLKS